MADLNKFIRDLEKFEKRINRIQNRTLSAKNMKKFGQLAVDQIVKRSRRGFGISANKQKKFKRLKRTPKGRSTVDQRRRNRDRLDSTTSPGKSNITATGQMLKALKVFSKFKQFSIGFKSGKRKGELSSKTSTMSNEEVAFWVEKNGRRFLALTTKEKQILLKRIKRDILKEV